MPRASTLCALAFAAAVLAPAAPAAACSITATGVQFGAYDTLAAAPLDGAGSIVLRCHPSVHAPTIGIGPGNSGSFAARALSNGSAFLLYNLYASPARLVVLGDGSGGSIAIEAGDGTVRAGTRIIEVPIYGRIPALQPVPAGTYSDTLFVTITF